MNNVTQTTDTAGAPQLPFTLGQLAQMAYDVREEKRRLDAESAECGKRLDELKDMIWAKMEAEGLDKTSVNGISLSRSVTQVPNNIDWDQVHAYIAETGQLNLLQRRLSTTLWRELLEFGTPVPGVDVFEKHDINLRKA